MKKLLILVMMAASFGCVAQPLSSSDCSNFIKSTKDRMTGEFTYSGIDNIYPERKIFISLAKTPKPNMTFVSLIISSKGCMEKNSIINILFIDSSRMEVLNNNKFNCDGQATFDVGGINSITPANVAKLKTKEIAAIRVHSMRSYEEADLTEEEANNFMRQINCLLKK